MSSELPQDPTSSAVEALAFAEARLGPRCELLLARPEVQVAVLSRRRAGADLEDAVLAEVFRAALEDRRLADEFVAYFLVDLMGLGAATLGRDLRRFLDTGDLVQSVLGDLWPELASVTFETRGRFLSYLARRMRWKTGSKVRRMQASRRREDLRLGDDPSDLGLPSASTSPSVRASDEEERSLLILRLLRLSERDRELMTLHLRGEPVGQIAERLELSPAAARKALQRAIHRTRGLS